MLVLSFITAAFRWYALLSVFPSALRLLDEPLLFDPCCLMSPPPPPLFPPPSQLLKQSTSVGVHKHIHTPACINTPHLHIFVCSQSATKWNSILLDFVYVWLKDGISTLEPSVSGGEERKKQKPVIPGCSPGYPGPQGPQGPEVRPFFKILDSVGNLTEVVQSDYITVGLHLFDSEISILSHWRQ